MLRSEHEILLDREKQQLLVIVLHEQQKFLAFHIIEYLVNIFPHVQRWTFRTTVRT
tara:strand:- start:343 stop:510 length:168 start_codon:yes stop_codon:yes gene_type:complete